MESTLEEKGYAWLPGGHLSVEGGMIKGSLHGPVPRAPTEEP